MNLREILTPRRRRIAAAAISVAAAVSLVAACGTSSNPTSTGAKPLKGGVAVIANFSAGPNYIFPLDSSEYFSSSNISDLQELMWRPLYWYGVGSSPDINYKLSIGQPPVYTNGGKTVTVKLNHFEWSNGTPVTSRDIVFWQNLVTANKANWGDYSPGDYPDNVVSVKAVNPTTVQFNLKSAYDDNWFTYNELSQITPIPTYAWDKTSVNGKIGNYDMTTKGAVAVYNFLNTQAKKLTTYATNPLWKAIDGPWRLTSYTASDGDIKMLPNPDWTGSKPYLAGFDEKTYTTTAAEFNALQAGNGPSYGYISPVELGKQAELTANGYVQSKQYSFEVGYNFMNFNNPTVGPLFKQLYIRQVIQLMDDQAGIDKAYFSNTEVPGCGPIPPIPPNSFADATESTDCPYVYSPTKAMALLVAHGWTVNVGGTSVCAKPGTAADECGAGITKGEPLKFTFAYPTGGIAYPKSVAQIKSDSEKVGLTLDLQPTDPTTLYDNTVACKPSQASCKWQISATGGWIYAPDYYPTGEPLFATGAGYNLGSYSDPETDKLIKATTEPGDPQTTLDAYQDYVAKQLPVLWTQTGYGLEEVLKNLHGVTPFNTFGNITPETWYFTGSIPKANF